MLEMNKIKIRIIFSEIQVFKTNAKWKDICIQVAKINFYANVYTCGNLNVMIFQQEIIFHQYKYNFFYAY